MEDNIARIFEWNGRNYKEKAVVENTASKRNVKEFEKREKDFYEQIKRIIEESQKEKTVISGPGFWGKNFYEKFYKGKAYYLPSSSSEKSAVRELIQSKEFSELLKQEKEARDYEKFNEFLKHLGKEDKAICYGLKEIEEYADKNNLETVLALEGVVEGMKEELLQKLSSQCELSIILEDSELGRELNSFKIIGLKKYVDR
ncbi:eRF1 domain 3 [uncultured archaeon]|nr:eRF1 domain 3 [uncultured archaeon]